MFYLARQNKTYSKILIDEYISNWGLFVNDAPKDLSEVEDIIYGWICDNEFNCQAVVRWINRAIDRYNYNNKNT